MALSPSRIRIRRALTVAALVLLASGVWAFLRFGLFLSHEDPLQNADAILVLAGSRLERSLEAADLYREGRASTILMTDWLPEAAIGLIRAQGIPFARDVDQQTEVMERLGVPLSAVLVPPRLHDNTAQEAQTLLEYATARGWKRVIVVSAKYHLRRSGFAIRRELAGTGIEVIMRATRYDPSNPARWWASRADLRWVLSEGTKYVAYVSGLGAGN